MVPKLLSAFSVLLALTAPVQGQGGGLNYKATNWDYFPPRNHLRSPYSAEQVTVQFEPNGVEYLTRLVLRAANENIWIQTVLQEDPDPKTKGDESLFVRYNTGDQCTTRPDGADRKCTSLDEFLADRIILDHYKTLELPEVPQVPILEIRA